MVWFQTKNPNLGKFWKVLQWKMLVHWTVSCYIFCTFGIVRGDLVYFFSFLVFCTKKNLATLLPPILRVICFFPEKESELQTKKRAEIKTVCVATLMSKIFLPRSGGS
jgi:hypothetical protein